MWSWAVSAWVSVEADWRLPEKGWIDRYYFSNSAVTWCSMYPLDPQLPLPVHPSPCTCTFFFISPPSPKLRPIPRGDATRSPTLFLITSVWSFCQMYQTMGIKKKKGNLCKSDIYWLERFTLHCETEQMLLSENSPISQCRRILHIYTQQTLTVNTAHYCDLCPYNGYKFKT